MATITVGKSVFNLPASSVVGPNIQTYTPATGKTTTQETPGGAIGSQQAGSNAAPVVAPVKNNSGNPVVNVPGISSAPATDATATGATGATPAKPIPTPLAASAAPAVDAQGNPINTNPTAPVLAQTPAQLEQAAYDQLTQQAQGGISAIEGYYNNLLAGEDTTGAERKANATGAALASGEFGTGTGAGSMETARAATTANKSAITSKLASDVATVIQNVTANAQTLATAMGTAQDKIKSDAIASLDTLAATGKSAQDIKDAEPEFYQNLLNQTGYSEYQLAAAIDSNPKNPNAPVVKEVPMASSDGTSTILKRITFNPKTGQSTEQDYTVAMPLATFLGSPTTTTKDGQILQQQPDGTYKNITPGVIVPPSIQKIGTNPVTGIDEYGYFDSNSGKLILTNANGTPTGATAPGTTGSPNIDSSASGYTTTQIPGSGGLTQAAIDKAALYYAITGTMPSVGLGGTGAAAMKRNAVQARAAELDSTGQITANKAKFQALTQSLDTQTTYLNTMERSVNTVEDNIKILQSAADKVNNSQSPLVNEWTNLAKSKVIGSGDLAAYRSALQTVRTEYGIILARGGQVTESTRAEAAQLIPDNISKDQLNQVIGVLMAEGQNVKSEAQNQVDDINSQLNNIIGGGDLYGGGSGNIGGSGGGGSDNSGGSDLNSIDWSQL